MAHRANCVSVVRRWKSVRLTDERELVPGRLDGGCRYVPAGASWRCNQQQPPKVLSHKGIERGVNIGRRNIPKHLTFVGEAILLTVEEEQLSCPREIKGREIDADEPGRHLSDSKA